MKKNRLEQLMQRTEEVPSVAQMMSNRQSAPAIPVTTDVGGPMGDNHVLHQFKTGVGVATQAAKLMSQINRLENELKISRELSVAINIPLELIERNPWLSRSSFSPESFEALCLSIQTLGVLQPISVRKHPSEPTKYQLIFGERRVRAARAVGLKEIPCVTFDTVLDAAMTSQSLAENIQRLNLTDYEIGKALNSLLAEFPEKMYIVQSLGISKSKLHSYQSFLKLETYMLDDLNVNPSLVDAELAEKLVSLKAEPDYESLSETLAVAWNQLKDGLIEQDSLIFRARQLRKDSLSQSNEKGLHRTLFLNGENIGFVSEDDNEFVIQIQNSTLTAEHKSELMGLIDKLFEVGSPQESSND